jgi:hypothetical protein
MNNEENSLEYIDDADEAINDIFTLPREMANDARISQWYQEMVQNLRAEAQGIPMKTNQYFLMERIAFLYAMIRFKELGEATYSGRDHRDDLKVLGDYMDKFNKLLETHNDKVVHELIMKVQAILAEALPMITDDRERANLRRHLQEEFASIDL